LVAITNPFGQSFYFDYDAAGEPTLRDAPVGRSSGSPGLGWLHAKSDNSVIASYDYERDGRGSPTRITDKDDHYRGFTYDGLNRLASETWRDENDQVLDRKLYYYDPADNRIALDQDGEPVIYYTYDARDALVAEYTAAGTPTYTTYNEAGSLLTEAQGANVTSYVWTPEELLARVDLPSGLSNYFEYDGDGRRWSKRDSDGLKRYLWDATPSGQPGLAVVLEKDDAGETTGAFTHDQGVTIMPGVGTILSVREGEADYLFHTDAQGTTREVTDASQIVVASFDLDAWGVERSRSGSFSTPYLFTGKERDPNPLLDYFIARQYQPRWGAFVSRDPLWPGEPAAAGALVQGTGSRLAGAMPFTPDWVRGLPPYVYAGGAPLAAWDADGRLFGGGPPVLGPILPAPVVTACNPWPGKLEQYPLPPNVATPDVPANPTKAQCLEWLEGVVDHSYNFWKLVNTGNCVVGPGCRERMWGQLVIVRAYNPSLLSRLFEPCAWSCYVECAWCGYRNYDFPLVSGEGTHPFPLGPCRVVSPGTPFDHAQNLRNLCRWLDSQKTRLERCFPYIQGRRGTRLYQLLFYIFTTYGDNCARKGCL